MKERKHGWNVDKVYYAIYAEQEDGTMTFNKLFAIALDEYYDDSKKLLVSPYDELQAMQEYINDLKNSTRALSLMAYFFHDYRRSKNSMQFDIPVSEKHGYFIRAKRVYPSYKYLLRI